MVNIEDIDKNFKAAPITQADVVWHRVQQEPFSLHGVYYQPSQLENEYGSFMRFPQEVGEKINFNIQWFSSIVTGGRVRFMTNSPYVAVKAVVVAQNPHRNSNFLATHGFGVYANDTYRGSIAPANVLPEDAVDGLLLFSGVCSLPTQCLEEICITMPTYSKVRELYVGVKEGCSLQTALPYQHQKPVVFYGSSITQGGCASHSGNDYESMLSRWLNTDFINLGFSGSAKGEPELAEYIAGLDMSVFVMDYDYNAPNAEHLQATHFPFYEIVRKAQPKLPIIFVSAANTEYLKDSDKRREVIINTYKTAKKRGDKNVWFVDGTKIYGKDDVGGRNECTVDGIHPNDLGMYRIAKAVYPTLKKAIKKSKYAFHRIPALLVLIN